MPIKSYKPCKKCGVATMSKTGYCSKHENMANIWRNPKVEKVARPHAAARGYNYKWQKFRAEYLSQNPICCLCGQKAEAIDHIIPHRGDKELFWDVDNLQSLCTICHNRKTALQDSKFTKGRKIGEYL